MNAIMTAVLGLNGDAGEDYPIDVVLMDIDGTLANAEHRMHLCPTASPAQASLSGELYTPSWEAFLGAAKDDPVNPEILTLNNAMSEHALIFVVTGRDARDRVETEAWLDRNNVLHDRLYMRPLGDRREDCVVKKEILEIIRAEGFKVLFAVEDRQRVVKMWRENGVRALQVCEGDY